MDICPFEKWTLLLYDKFMGHTIAHQLIFQDSNLELHFHQIDFAEIEIDQSDYVGHLRREMCPFDWRPSNIRGRAWNYELSHYRIHYHIHFLNNSREGMEL